MTPLQKQTESAADLGRYAGLGLQFVITLALCGGLGWWLDARLGSSPWALVAGILLGAVIAFFTIVRAVPPARAVHPTRPPLPDDPDDDPDRDPRT